MFFDFFLIAIFKKLFENIVDQLMHIKKILCDLKIEIEEVKRKQRPPEYKIYFSSSAKPANSCQHFSLKN
jgi:hypothetical protein